MDRPTLNDVPASLQRQGGHARQWLDLSLQFSRAVRTPRPCSVNATLEEATTGEPESPAAPAFLLWAAENYAREGRHHEAVEAFERVVQRADSVEPMHPALDFTRAARHHQAASAAELGRVDQAISVLRQLAEREPRSPAFLLEAGMLAEEAGRANEALELYRSISAAEPGSSTEAPQELARRALLRIDASDGLFFPTAQHAASALTLALDEGDRGGLERLLSRTHFVAGPMGGHAAFEEAPLREVLLDELAEAGSLSEGALLGSGDKRYLMAEVDADLLAGPVGLVVQRSPRGWEWTGIAITTAGEEWIARWAPEEPASNQPLPLFFRAPWPRGLHFMAGGIAKFARRSKAVQVAGPFGIALALRFADSDCGFGPRGFYYNSLVSHNGVDAFAIDFTRGRPGVPFVNGSGGTPVLAGRAGLVVKACGGNGSGSSSGSNTVELLHVDPSTGDEYLSRYLHLAGPSLLSVCFGQAVQTGQRLGLMNDTGSSLIDHLHFSIHAQSSPAPGTDPGCGGTPRGSSVRVSPLDGATLGDGDSGKCVLSNNTEFRSPPPDDAEFVGQEVPRQVRPLQRFAASITMRNSGPTTWSAGYQLVAVDRAWSPSDVSIGQEVAPGEEISRDFEVATLSPGDHQWRWQMSRPRGRLGHDTFGQMTSSLLIQASAREEDPCPELVSALEGKQAELRSLQDMLEEFPGTKGDILEDIRRVGAEIAGLKARAQRLGCAVD